MSTPQPPEYETSTDAERPRLTVGGFTPPTVPRPSSELPAAASSKRLVSITQGVVRALVVSPALLFPVLWLIVCLVLRGVLGTRRRMRGGTPEPLLSAVVSGVSDHAARVRKTGYVAGLLGALLVGLGLAAIAAGVAAGMPVLWWVATQGTTGILVALRLGLLAWAVPILGALLCWRLLAGLWKTTDAPESFSTLEDGFKIGISGVALVALVLVVVAGPYRPWAPAGSLYGLTSVLPGATRDSLRDAEVDLVQDQAEAVLQCIVDDGRDIGWQVEGIGRRDDGAIELRVGRGSLTSAGTTRRDNSVLALALHNQLPGSVESLVIVRHESFEPLVIDRSKAHHRAPETDVKKLARAAGVEDPVLPTSDRVVEEALRCGAAHV